MFKLELGANVPLYGQEKCFWCGAASAQMSMNGYPNPSNRAYFAQVGIWNSIQAHNSSAPADAGWATDPLGLQGCMMALNPPPGGAWDVFSNASRDGLMFSIMYWMNRLQYPAPVLINQGGHWVVIVGYESDVAPTGGATPTLQKIHYHDPEPHNVGTDTTLTAASWNGSPFNGAIVYSGTWLNKYVAVVEPPTEPGRVIVKEVKRIGTKVISPKAALEYAQRWIKEHELAGNPKYGLLSRNDLAGIEPILVREQIKPGRAAGEVPFYYIVPFGIKSEVNECGARLARVVVMVNGFTGDFEEVTAFGAPVRFLDRDEAVRLVARHAQLGRDELARVEANMVFTPGEITHVRSYPFWEVKFGRRTLYVDLLGVIYTHLRPSIPGD